MSEIRQESVADFRQESVSEIHQENPAQEIQEKSVPFEDPDEAVLSLARQITNISLSSRGSNLIPNDLNPFVDFSNPLLNPQDPKFSPRAWAKHLLSLQSRDPETFPLRHAGVSFKNMGAYGHGTGYDYQKTVLNIIPSSISYITSLGSKGSKIQILRDVNGVIKPGELCVVLGRPGR